MRLKTKLVLAITALVFLIAALVSLVYASQLLHGAVKQSYDTNHMVAEQIRFALQNALETGLRDQTVNPNDPSQLRALMTNAVRDNEELQAVVQSVNLYSLTVYDINPPAPGSQVGLCSVQEITVQQIRCGAGHRFSWPAEFEHGTQTTNNDRLRHGGHTSVWPPPSAAPASDGWARIPATVSRAETHRRSRTSRRAIRSSPPARRPRAPQPAARRGTSCARLSSHGPIGDSARLPGAASVR